MKTYLNERGGAYLDEIVWFFWDEYKVEISESTLSRVLKRIHWTRKVVRYSQQLHITEILIK